MKLVMFDVDGTLTDTQVGDENAFVRALREVLGLSRINTDWDSYPRVTSESVLQEIARTQLGRAASPAESRAAQERLVELLGGRVREVPGAASLLRRLPDAGFGVALASGDWEYSARHKLAVAGIPCEGVPAAFGLSGEDRSDVMRRSLKSAQRHYRGGEFERITYVGDGPWDLRAARTLGWGFLGVGSGARAVRLRAAGARRIVPDFRDVDLVLAALETQTV